MQDSRINYVLVGAFVAAMLVAFIVVVSMLAGRSGATDPYFTVYNNVGGIKSGTIVFYEGYQVGQVVKIEPQQQGSKLSFRVDLEVKHGWHIPEDSLARSMVSGLLAAVAIDIKAGKSATLLKPGSEIRGQEAGNFFATLADIGAQFGDLSTNSIKPLLDNLNAYIQQLSSATAGHLPEIMANLDKIAASVQRSSDVIDKSLLKPQNIEHIDSMIASADQAAANLVELSKGLEQTRATLNQSIQKIDKMVDSNTGNVDEAMRSFRYTLDTLARYVDDIAHNADTTARNMAEFSRSIRENPGLLLGGSKQPDQTNSRDRRK
jgi:phospholipid/cholesterol/gamma-HCH transport system substrate-binding protein